MMGAEPVEKSYEKRQKAMKNRLKKLGTDNPVVKKAVKNNEPKHDSYQDFEPVHELVSAAYATYCEHGNLKQCLKDLGAAIVKLSSSASNKPITDSEDTDYED